MSDLTDQQFGGFKVTERAPARDRVRYWSLACLGCGLIREEMQVSLKQGFVPTPCGTCSPPLAAAADDTWIWPWARPESGAPAKPVAIDDSAALIAIRVDAERAAREAAVIIEVAADTVGAVAVIESDVSLVEAPEDPFTESSWSQFADVQTSTPVPESTVGKPDVNEVYRQQLMSVVDHGMRGHERSKQSMIGPSELGTPCERKLAHRLAFGKHEREPSWRPTVGTAVHAWLDAAVGRNPERLDDGSPRWLAEKRVIVGQLGGNPIKGTSDLFDARDGVVCDWKAVGITTLKKARAGVVSDTYRGQVMMYGLGMEAAGFVVNKVGVMFLPTSGELGDSVWREWAYDRELALGLIARAERISALLTIAPADKVMGIMETADDWCTSCPASIFSSNADSGSTCTGHRN